MTAILTPPRQSASVATGLGTLALAALVVSADGEEGIVVCPFRRCTGGYCPGCGGTRAVRHLLGGNLRAAWTDHPWVVLALVQAAAVAAVVGLGRRQPGGPVRLDRARGIGMRLVMPNVVILVAVWMLRLMDGSIPRFW